MDFLIKVAFDELDNQASYTSHLRGFYFLYSLRLDWGIVRIPKFSKKGGMFGLGYFSAELTNFWQRTLYDYGSTWTLYMHELVYVKNIGTVPCM